MGVIAKDDNQITLYYSSETSMGKQTYAYVESSERKVRDIDISKTKVTGTQWAELAEGLKLPISKLVNTDHPDFQDAYDSENADLDENDWIKILQNSPQVLSAAIAIIGKEFIRIENPSDFEKFIESDSTGLPE